MAPHPWIRDNDKTAVTILSDLMYQKPEWVHISQVQMTDTLKQRFPNMRVELDMPRQCELSEGCGHASGTLHYHLVAHAR